MPKKREGRQVNRELIKRIRPAIDGKLEDLAKSLGFNVKAGNATYGSGYFEIKVRFSLPGESPEADAFRELGPMYGFEPEDLGREFVVGRTTYKVSGLASRSRKFPVLAVGPDGKTYKFPEDVVRRCLGRKDPYADLVAEQASDLLEGGAR